MVKCSQRPSGVQSCTARPSVRILLFNGFDRALTWGQYPIPGTEIRDKPYVIFSPTSDKVDTVNIYDWEPGIGDPTFIGWFTVFAYLIAAVLCGVNAARR